MLQQLDIDAIKSADLCNFGLIHTADTTNSCVCEPTAQWQGACGLKAGHHRQSIQLPSAVQLCADSPGTAQAEEPLPYPIGTSTACNSNSFNSMRIAYLV